MNAAREWTFRDWQMCQHRRASLRVLLSIFSKPPPRRLMPSSWSTSATWRSDLYLNNLIPQIYNEEVRDLLGKDRTQKLEIKEHSEKVGRLENLVLGSLRGRPFYAHLPRCDILSGTYAARLRKSTRGSDPHEQGSLPSLSKTPRTPPVPTPFSPSMSRRCKKTDQFAWGN